MTEPTQGYGPIPPGQPIGTGGGQYDQAPPQQQQSQEAENQAWEAGKQPRQDDEADS